MERFARHSFAWTGVAAAVLIPGAVALGLVLGWSDQAIGGAEMVAAVLLAGVVIVLGELEERSAK